MLVSIQGTIARSVDPAAHECCPMRRLSNIHPGEVLLKEFLEPLHLSQNRAARDMSVPPRRLNGIVHGKRRVTADTALRLARYFGTSERFWLGLQADYDLEEARRLLGGRLEREGETASFVA